MGILDIFNKNEETKSDKKSKKIAKKIVKSQLYRFQNEIKLWKTAISDFEDPFHSTNEELIRVYNDAVIDSHLFACIEARKSKTLSKDFKIVLDDEEDRELTEILESEWFVKFVSSALDSLFFGYSLLQFDDRVENEFTDIDLVPREYVYAKGGIVRQYPSSNTGTSYTSGVFSGWLLGVGDSDDLGLLSKATPLTIYKKNAIGAWAEFSELFGSPMRMGRTNVRDEELRDNMYDMLSEMGNSAYGVFDHDDVVELVESTKADAYEVFDKQIERYNSEISKLILGSTMTTDDGSSRSQSEVHENTTSAIVKRDAMFIQNVVNNQLIPFLERHHGFNFKGGKFVFDDTEVISLVDRFAIDGKLLDYYSIPTSYITETYGTPVEEKELVGGTDVGKSKTPQNLENSIKELYDICCENIDSTDAPEPNYNQEEELHQAVYNGEITTDTLPLSLYEFTGSYLSDAIKGGISSYSSLGLLYVPDQAFYDVLRENVYEFSSARTKAHITELSKALLDENGNTRSFASFKKEATKITGQFNKNYLKTEYGQAFNGAQMASKWEDILESSEDFPKLRYITVGDGRVRQSHKELDGVVRPISDVSFWSQFYPPNGWNCRCDVLKEEADIKDTPKSEIKTPKMDDMFKTNVGATRKIFSDKHPYIQEYGTDNGLPKPPKDPLNG